ncbi:DNA-binding transcriptional regulator, PadR family [Actinomadura meyerae]|jgi:DNA-binding PadR family transcriptional regulator|uniref:DNA-binding transcriptional regulator, PadR family n=1 Tax=Actinomadura meyerae TaxID=240840 RepID=A0A239K1E2_9ACTN|nr:PadR family transcriptional regulator [Actinomadura meyerae]SNT12177.1 DNA-binding transcriptional regulator, PadR family [Actinomadura meyerae]
MAKRRKVGNLLGLAVLSTVSAKPMHPYEMAAVMRARGKDRDMGIKWGSLYTVVGNLEKHGFLAVEGSVREGARPERTVYRITDAGRAELADWVRELIAVPEPEVPRFEAGLSVLGALGPDEVAALLRRRLDALERRIAADAAALAEAGVPRVFLIEGEYDLAIRRAEAAWVRGFLAEIEDGTLPHLDTWRAFHETGELPPEIAEMAERGAPEEQ